MPTPFTLNGQPVTGAQAEAHFVDWCLSLQNHDAPGVPRDSLDAVAAFQRGASRGDSDAAELIERSGISLV